MEYIIEAGVHSIRILLEMPDSSTHTILGLEAEAGGALGPASQLCSLAGAPDQCKKLPQKEVGCISEG